MITATVPSFFVRIYMSGPIEVAKQVCRSVCLPGGLCVTIEPTLFIFAGGEEAGFVIGLVNYPRFPVSDAVLLDQARNLAHAVLTATQQHSGLIVTPVESEWFSIRDQTTSR